MENNIIQRIAAKAVIVNDGKVLIIRESSSYEEGTNMGKYDFPGGRIEPGEALETALKREAKEECGLDIQIGQPFYVGEWRPVVKGAKLQIFGIFFKCRAENSKIVLGSDFDDYKWIGYDEREKFNLLPAVGEAIEILFENEK